MFPAQFICSYMGNAHFLEVERPPKSSSLFSPVGKRAIAVFRRATVGEKGECVINNVRTGVKTTPARAITARSL